MRTTKPQSRFLLPLIMDNLHGGPLACGLRRTPFGGVNGPADDLPARSRAATENTRRPALTARWLDERDGTRRGIQEGKGSGTKAGSARYKLRPGPFRG